MIFFCEHAAFASEFAQRFLFQVTFTQMLLFQKVKDCLTLCYGCYENSFAHRMSADICSRDLHDSAGQCVSLHPSPTRSTQHVNTRVATNGGSVWPAASARLLVTMVTKSSSLQQTRSRGERKKNPSTHSTRNIKAL